METSIPIDWSAFVNWAFVGLLAFGIGWVVRFLSQISISMNKLNEQIAVIIERVVWVVKEVETHDGRLDKLEKRRK